MINILKNTFTPFRWIRYYTLSNLGNDIVAGMTLSTVNLPQSMAYALLASLPPEFGLYSAALGSIAHLIFGISPFVSVGPFAVVSLMTGNALISTCQTIYQTDTSLELQNPWEVFPLLIPLSAFLTFCIGSVLFLIFVLRLGVFINKGLSDNSIKGFTASAAISIVVSQLKGILGIPFPPVTGTYLIGKTLYCIFENIRKTNWMSLVIGVSTIALIYIIGKLELVLGSDKFISWLANSSPSSSNKDSRINVPKVLITIFILTLVSYLADLNSRFKVAIIGKVTTGVPSITAPWKVFEMVKEEQKLGLFLNLIPYILTICLVTYCTMRSILQTFPSPEESTNSGNAPVEPTPSETESDNSMERSTSREVLNSLDVDEDVPVTWTEEANELLAVAVANLFCSVGSGFAASGSLSRSAILATQTQAASPLADFFSSALVWLAALFLSGGIYYIPMACLSGIVIYALHSTLLRITDGFKLFKAARIRKDIDTGREFGIWIVTFLSVLVWDPSTGIIIGIGLNLLIECALFIKKRLKKA